MDQSDLFVRLLLGILLLRAAKSLIDAYWEAIKQTLLPG